MRDLLSRRLHGFLIDDDIEGRGFDIPFGYIRYSEGINKTVIEVYLMTVHRIIKVGDNAFGLSFVLYERFTTDYPHQEIADVMESKVMALDEKYRALGEMIFEDELPNKEKYLHASEIIYGEDWQ